MCDWSDFISELNPSILLCVASGAPTSSLHLDWCLDNQIELVELHPASRSEDAEDTREKFGMDRVLEALQNNLWENATMKERPEFGRFDEGDAEKNEGSIFDGLEISSEPTAPEKTLSAQKESAPAALAPLPLTSTNATTQVTNTEVINTNVLDENKANELLPPNFLRALHAPQEDFDLEAVVNSLKSVREKAAHLPDEDRRALAATVALSFAKLLDGDSSDDE